MTIRLARLEATVYAHLAAALVAGGALVATIQLGALTISGADRWAGLLALVSGLGPPIVVLLIIRHWSERLATLLCCPACLLLLNLLASSDLSSTFPGRAYIGELSTLHVIASCAALFALAASAIIVIPLARRANLRPFSYSLMLGIVSAGLAYASVYFLHSPAKSDPPLSYFLCLAPSFALGALVLHFQMNSLRDDIASQRQVRT